LASLTSEPSFSQQDSWFQKNFPRTSLFILLLETCVANLTEERITFFSSLRVRDGYILIASFRVKFSSSLSYLSINCVTNHRVHWSSDNVDKCTTLMAQGGTLGISRWGRAARTLEPLAYTRASLSWILLPYTRVNSPNHSYPRVADFRLNCDFWQLKCYWNEIFVSSFICSIYSLQPV